MRLYRTTLGDAAWVIVTNPLWINDFYQPETVDRNDSRKGLQGPGVPGGGPARRGAQAPAPREDEKAAARVFYVAATRATQRLVLGVGGNGSFGEALGS